MTTIKDVAKLAGVGVSTVSYALNGTGTVSEATRQKILKAAEALNYHPNGMARNLKMKKTHTIGVFISRFGGAFYEEILEGIHAASMQAKYELIVCPESETTHKILTQRQVDGAIIFDSKINSDILIRLATKHFPIVTLDRVLGVEHTYPLMPDNRQGAITAFNHLYAQGYRKIAFVAGSKDAHDNLERTEAFLGVAKDKNIVIEQYEGDFTHDSGYRIGKTIINTNDLPEAVFCANDQMALGFMKAMAEYHLKAPQDIAIVGFDDITLAQYNQLTTIGVSRKEWGALAAKQLIELIEDETPFRSYKIRVKLIERASSGKRK
ncbi:MAG: LacI family transcriptional regulator [Erysipelotrichaceae bacterium]|nr:MAG: LacI family transcriptional [Erysipelotrichaceae bacterium]TXT19079.1 MAG: LacI family transcriptional regulator [Erysipelotrichaceae bacterium]